LAYVDLSRRVLEEILAENLLEGGDLGAVGRDQAGQRGGDVPVSILDDWWLGELFGAQRGVDRGCPGVDVALTSSSTQRRGDLGLGQPAPQCGGRSDRQNRHAVTVPDVVERLDGCRIELSQ